MSDTVPPHANADAALVMVLVLDKLLRLSSAELEAAKLNLEDVKTSTRKTVAWAREYAIRAERDTQADSALQADLNALMADIESAIDDDSAERALDALVTLAGRLEARLPFSDLPSLERFMEGSEAWKPGMHGRRRIGPPKEAVARLGRVCEPPLNRAACDLLRILTQDRDNLWVRPLAGTQVSIRRPKGYSHHGLLMGDGTVVDYNGEPTIEGLRNAAVRRTTLGEFLAGQSTRNLVRSFVTHGAQRHPLAMLRPGAACLRAARSQGQRGYDLLFNNCEHFASWAVLGMPISGQLDAVGDLGKLVGKVGGRRALADVDVVLARLGYTLQTEPEPLTEPVLTTDTIPPLPIDVARAYWAEDRRRLVIWMPLWQEGTRPLGGVDHPWALDGFSEDADCYASPPSIALDQSWHASLIAFPDGSSYWLDRRGEWFRERADPLPVLEHRLAPTARMLEELHAGPGRFASKVIRGLRKESAEGR